MKIRQLLIIILFTATALSASAFSFIIDRLCYTRIGNGEVEVTYEQDSSPSYFYLSGAITIPSSVEHKGFTYSVTRIGDYAFRGCNYLTSVTIPNSVKSIGNKAFYDCTGITNVSISDSVTTIGDYAFQNCSGLTYITIPNLVTEIGDNAFRGCTGLTNVTWNAKNCKDFSNFTNSPFYGSGRATFKFGDEVEHIPAYLCWGRASMTSVTIPNSVTSIGSSAFERCLGLTNVTIPNSVRSIGNKAFCDCTGLTSVTIGNSVTAIGGSAFEGCTGLTSVTIGNSVTTIGGFAFYNCSGLTNVIIPNSVTSIGDKAFYNCTGLTSVTIPNSVTTIGGGAFYNCSGLTSVTIGNSVTSIGNYAFSGCTSLPEVTIPNLVTTIGINAFSDCTDLTSVTIGNSVTTIGNSAFEGCTRMTSVTIGNSVTSIANYAFSGCTGLTSVTWNAKNCKDFYKVHSTDEVTSPFRNFTNITSFKFGDKVEYIPASLCSGLTGLTSVTIPKSVTAIGHAVFSGCTGLTSVTWNAKNCKDFDLFYVTDWYKANITTFNFGNEVEHIPAGLCRGLTGLTSVTIPNSVTSVGDKSFYKCTGLTSVTWNAKNCKDIASGPLFSSKSNITSFKFGDEVEHIPANLCRGLTGLTSVTIPNSVTTIGGSAFSGCTGLTSVTIGNSVTTISGYAFSGCTGLTSVTIPNSVTTIGNYAFEGCSGLTSVTIGNSVTTIGGYAFYNCSGLANVTWNAKNCEDFDFMYGNKMYAPFLNKTNITTFKFGNEVEHIPAYLCRGLTGLTSVTIPNSVTSIGDKAFYNCTGLTSVTWNAKNCEDFSSFPFQYWGTRITSFKFGDEVEHIPAGLCCGLTGLTSVTIPNSVTTIGKYAFRNCTGLTSVTIPNSVTTIGEYAFRNCTGLTSVTIPNSVTTIGDYAFQSCTGLTSFDSYVDNPNNITLGIQVFYLINKNCTLRVPKGSLSLYKNAEQWRDFLLIKSLSEDDGVDDVYFETKGSPRYNLLGLPVDDNYKGLVIQDGKKILVE